MSRIILDYEEEQKRTNHLRLSIKYFLFALTFFLCKKVIPILIGLPIGLSIATIFLMTLGTFGYSGLSLYYTLRGIFSGERSTIQRIFIIAASAYLLVVSGIHSIIIALDLYY